MKKIRIPENLTTLAYKTIRNYILDGQLDENARLTEEGLAQQLGISKSPIREALTKLESEGLIRIEPRRGAYLRKFSPKDLEDLYDLRAALEAHAASRAEITEQLIAGLRLSVDRMSSFLERGDKAGYIEEDVRFHTLIADATGNERLKSVLEGIQRQVWIFRRKARDLAAAHGASFHSDIVNALASGDREKAVRAIREHVSEAHRQLAEFGSARGQEVRAG